MEGKLVQLGLVVLVEVSERFASGAVQRELNIYVSREKHTQKIKMLSLQPIGHIGHS